MIDSVRHSVMEQRAGHTLGNHCQRCASALLYSQALLSVVVDDPTNESHHIRMQGLEAREYIGERHFEQVVQ